MLVTIVKKLVFCSICIWNYNMNFARPNNAQTRTANTRPSYATEGDESRLLLFSRPTLSLDRYHPSPLSYEDNQSQLPHKTFRLLNKITKGTGCFACVIAPVRPPSPHRLSGSRFGWSVLFTAFYTIQFTAFLSNLDRSPWVVGFLGFYSHTLAFPARFYGVCPMG